MDATRNGNVAARRTGIALAPDEYLFGSQSPDSNRASSDRFSTFTSPEPPAENCWEGLGLTVDGTSSVVWSKGA